MEAKSNSPYVTQLQDVPECQSPCSIPEKNPDEHVQENLELCLKKPEEPFKVPTLLKVKPTTNKRTAEGRSGPSAKTTSDDHHVAAAAGSPTQAGDAGPPQSSPSSDGFAIPSSVAPRVPATSRAKPSRSPALPPPKAGGSAEPAAGGSAPAPAVYRPPAWSGCPPLPYSLEVLRGGRIVDTVSLEGRRSVVFGRLADCDVRLEHPSISRHHAALVYRWDPPSPPPYCPTHTALMYVPLRYHAHR